MVCIQVPMLLISEAIHSHRKTLSRRGAHVDDVAGRSVVTPELSHRGQHVPSGYGAPFPQPRIGVLPSLPRVGAPLVCSSQHEHAITTTEL